ncbi:MAG TPA: MEDS domain-containing protein, partial [Chitinophagaceae bacterium]|nr:MEDS domain-containing protein [Chitinophagaceae bacterium]
MSELRKSGIDVLGEIPWGSHFCNFYKAKQDLLDILIPYFKAGLENNEFCLCVISEPSDQLTVKEATSALRNALPDIDRYLAEGRIEIVSYEEWFLNKGVYDLNGVINRFIEKLNIILAKGFNGMRVNGGSGWLLGKEKELHKFEKELGKLIANQHMIVLCNFPLHGIRGDDVFDIAQTHQFAIARRKGKWEVIETAMQIQARAEIKKLNEELELRVVERTKELAATNIELRREIAERKHAETLLYTKEQEFRAIVENSPDQIIRYDREFRRTYVNPAVVRAYGLSVEALTDKPIGSVIQDAGLNDKEND